MNYKAPISGYYRVSDTITKFVPTGNTETVSNPKRKWWQFWKHKMITRPEYRIEKYQDGTKTIYLKEGDIVGSSLGIGRIHGTKDSLLT